MCQRRFWSGIAAFYAIVNLSPAEVALALREIQRVLQPGGRLLLSSTSAKKFLMWRICGVARSVLISISSGPGMLLAI